MDNIDKQEVTGGTEKDKTWDAFKNAYEVLDEQKRQGMVKLVAGYVLGQFYTKEEDINTRLREVRSSLNVEENENTDKLTSGDIFENKIRAHKLREQEAGLILNKLALEFGSKETK